MQLDEAQVTTEEVKQWRGLHLLHFDQSACSQKVRILLAEKDLAWTSHPVNLMREEHISPWYLGINPRGVVPVLVHDGQVHVESNDIMAYLDALPSATRPFFPAPGTADHDFMQTSLALEDSLHLALRSLTMGFMVPPSLARKSEATLARYESEGAEDPKRALEVQWWRDFAANGIDHDTALAAVADYRAAFEQLEARLAHGDWLLGTDPSALDIAWFISTHRLARAGYPLHWHPRLAAWARRLMARASFRGAVDVDPLPMRMAMRLYRMARNVAGTSLPGLIGRASRATPGA